MAGLIDQPRQHEGPFVLEVKRGVQAQVGLGELCCKTGKGTKRTETVRNRVDLNLTESMSGLFRHHLQPGYAFEIFPKASTQAFASKATLNLKTQQLWPSSSVQP